MSFAVTPGILSDKRYLRCFSVTGTLKGYDQLMNLVMDDVVEEYESEAELLIQ